MKLLTVKAAAAALGVSASLIYSLCAARKLRHERIGMGRGAIRIPEDAVEEFRRKSTVEATAVAPPRRGLRHLT